MEAGRGVGTGGHWASMSLASELDAKGTASYSVGAVNFLSWEGVGETVLFHFLLEILSLCWAADNGRKTRGLRNALLILEGGW